MCSGRVVPAGVRYHRMQAQKMEVQQRESERQEKKGLGYTALAPRQALVLESPPVLVAGFLGLAVPLLFRLAPSLRSPPLLPPHSLQSRYVEDSGQSTRVQNHKHENRVNNIKVNDCCLKSSARN